MVCRRKCRKSEEFWDQSDFPSRLHGTEGIADIYFYTRNAIIDHGCIVCF